MKKVYSIMCSFVALTAVNFNVLNTSFAKKIDSNLVEKIATPIEDKEELVKCLFLYFGKAYTITTHNVATKFIIKNILAPISDSVKDQPYFFKRMHVGEAAIDLPIYMSEDKSKNKKIEKFLKDEILDEKITKKIKKAISNEEKTKKEISNLIEEYYKGIEKEIKKFEQKLTTLEKKAKKPNFYYEYGKDHVISKINHLDFYKQDVRSFTDEKYVPNDVLDSEKESEILEKHLKDRRFLIEVGKKFYEKNKQKYEKIIKTYKNILKITDDGVEIKSDQKKVVHRKFSKDEIVREVFNILPDIRTTKKLPTFNNRFNQEYVTHIFEVYKLDEKN